MVLNVFNSSILAKIVQGRINAMCIVVEKFGGEKSIKPAVQSNVSFTTSGT